MEPLLYISLFITVFQVTTQLKTGVYGTNVEIEIESGNEVVFGSSTTIICCYNKLESETLATLAFTYGPENVNERTPIADYYFMSSSNPRYYDPFKMPAYTMTIDEIDEGSYGVSKLMIQSITLDDERRYWCAITLLGHTSMYAELNLTVTVPPRSITVDTNGENSQNGSSVTVIETIDYEFTCSADAARPPADLNWILAGQPTYPDKENEEIPDTGDPRLTDTKSFKTISPSWNSHHGRYLQCESSQRNIIPPAIMSVVLDVNVPVDQIRLLDRNQQGGYPDGSIVNVKEGISHIFTCDVLQTRPDANIEWYIDNIKIINGITTPQPPSNGEELVDTTSSLQIVPVRGHHKKSLACRARIDIDGAPGPKSHRVILEVDGPPDVPTLEGNNYLQEGSQQTFTCLALNAYPKGGIDWYNGGTNITQTAAVNTEDSTDQRYDISSTLTFTPNRRDNENTIKCDVIHDTLSGGEERSQSKVISVQFCTDDISISGNCPRDVVEGVNSVLTCSSTSSNPETRLIWSKDGTPAPDPATPVYDDSDYGGKTTTLSYTDQFVRGESGTEVKCCGTIDSISCNSCSTCTLNVVYPPDNVVISKNPPEAVPEGGTILLTCTSNGNPTPAITWKKQSASQAPGTTATDTLTFDSITRDQAGYYYCMADNGYQPPGQSDPETIIVHYTPEITNRDDNRRSADQGTTATLDCISRGNPEPIIAWYDRNGTLITNARNRYNIELTQVGDSDEIVGIILKSTLTIRDVIPSEDYGNFLCDSGNYVGHENMTIDLNGLTLPDAPQNVQILIEDSTQQSLTVSWEKGYNGGVDQWFVIMYKSSDGIEQPSGNITETEKASNYTHIVEGLKPGVRYMIRVHSGNKLGSNTDNAEEVGGITIPSSLDDLGISMIIDMNKGTVSVRGIVEDGDPLTCLQLQLRTKSDNTWIDWECINDNIEDIEVPNADRYDNIQGAFCVEGVCGHQSSGEVVKDKVVTGPDIGGIVGGLIGGVVVITVVVLLIIHYRRKWYHNHALEQKQTIVLTRRYDNDEDEHNVDMTVRKKDVLKCSNKNDAMSENECYANVSNAKFTFPRNNLQILRELGHGEFGTVLMAKAKGLMQGGDTATVAVKTLKDSAGGEAKNQLRKEFELMKLLTAAQKPQHPNIVQLLGACMEKDPMYVILEYMPKGDLKTLLRKSRVSKRDINSESDSAYGNLAFGCTSFTPPQLLTFARDVSNGMAFLAEQKCIHRDLAARNVLLNEHLDCKVSDFGLARDVMDGEIYQRLNECRLPLRWMAYESVVGDVHTIESDVWSFGVLLWEIVTLGGRPYPRMNGVEIRQLLKAGNRMPQPKHCSQQLYTIMSMCWQRDQKNRPTFVQLIHLLDDIIIGQMGYLSMEDLETTLYEDSSAPDANEKV